MSNLFARNGHSERENIRGGLPHPALSSASIHSSQRILKLPGSRWKTITDAIKRGTGYATKQPEWSSSMLDVSDQGISTGEDPDGALDDDELGWISGQNGEENLSLVLVEREPLAASQMSPGPTASQENITTSHDAVQHNRTKLANDHTYRLKGYEASIQDTEIGTLTPLFWVRYRLWPWIRRVFLRFCYPEFNDPQVEQIYSNRVYDSQKFLAFVCSAWMVLSWAIALTLLPNKVMVSDIIFYYCLAPILTIPLPVMIFYDLPKRFPIFYQCFLVISIWSWSANLIVFMQLCSYYGGSHAYISCAGRDMMNLFYYMIALPVIALFGLGQQRIYATIAALVMIIVPAVLFTPRHTVWVRFALEHLFLQALLLYIHWRREILERNVYFFNKKIRDTLVALHHTRTAQGRVEAARARATSYIFHEVRQPLNAAFLAYQNLVASTMIKPDQRFEWDTLRMKLASMSKLLNDVLDQKRMDAGKFEIVSRPYDFHQMIQQSVASCRMEAERKQQELTIELDKTIDRTALFGMFRAQRRSEEEITRLMTTMTEEHGVIMGDETRVTQVLTNLISNASKFTPKHGKIHIVTKLVPSISVPPTPLSARASQTFSGQPLLTSPEGSTAVASPISLGVSSKWNDTGDRLIVRMEVNDNGVGISPADVRERRLFSAFAQAGVGRLQGGSGSGLGLSLVRRMVKLMDGRMGVKSVVNKGTTFWVELPLKFASAPPSTDAILPPVLVSSPMGSYTSTGTTMDPSILASPVSLRSDTEASVAMPNRSGTTESNQSRDAAKTVSTLGSGLSVLIVDDDSIMRGLLKRLLLRLGCAVEGAENGQVALQKLGVTPSTDEGGITDHPDSTPRAETNQASPIARRYDVVFLDNQMPVLSGIEMVSALRKAGRRDFVVGLSGEAAAIDQERFRQAGANEVLAKPVLESQVKEILQKARERSASNGAPSIRVHQPP